jgi:hypothetical protein
MSADKPAFTVEQVVSTIRSEIASAPPETRPTHLGSIDTVREMQRRFRSEPIGGRLSSLKRLVYWWVASAFDRQGKVIEALIAELEASDFRAAELEKRVARLEAERIGGASGGKGSR